VGKRVGVGGSCVAVGGTGVNVVGRVAGVIIGSNVRVGSAWVSIGGATVGTGEHATNALKSNLTSGSVFFIVSNLNSYYHGSLFSFLCFPKRLHTRHIAHADRMHVLVDAANQACQHIFRTDLDKLGHALRGNVFNRLDPLH
jgi:hypothetical protein